ncbi:uncharacterized protein LOC122871917 isoform X3 [Siniperca chuatsi]|uniref:uncharacterized protein LOC122871917 isoform X3 n=1 Tax=Siniperca chuatsi TaxID=119488 RepID=UPI001CE0483F|nr:uncharacterized protein LOC122871917 isoform X3 [Siniperca chuatsi]
MASAPPLASLRLLLPPLRLLTAAMWRVTRQQSVKHYGMLEDFVSLVTEAVPQLLTDRQRSLLLLALRAKVTLCDPDPQAVHAHLDKIHSVSEATQPDEEVDEGRSALLTLTDRLTQSPADRQRLLQEVFDHSFDSALQSLMSDFLSRIEQLFPVPDFKQAASWLDAAPGGLEDCLQEADSEELRELLTNRSCLLGRATTTVGRDTEKILLAAWSHPFVTKLTNPDPPSTDTEVQSDPLPDAVSPIQLDVELVKVEVVVMTEDEQEEVEETVIGQTMSPVEHEASSERSAEGGDDCAVAPVILEVDRLKDSPGNFADQSEDTVDQSDPSCSEVTANALYSISHNSQRVAHKCPRCGKCFIYRSQVIRHLRTSKSCGAALTAPGAVNLLSQPVGPEEEPRPPEPRLPEPRPPRTHSCFQCNATFKTKAELLSHQRSHRARPVYQCGQCDKEFHHLSSLTNHKQTHLDKGGFTCSRCEKVFESAKERDAHRLQHRLPDLTCTVCDQTFSSQTQLLRHLQTHSVEGAEPCYNCRFCDQSFSGNPPRSDAASDPPAHAHFPLVPVRPVQQDVRLSDRPPLPPGEPHRREPLPVSAVRQALQDPGRVGGPPEDAHRGAALPLPLLPQRLHRARRPQRARAAAHRGAPVRVHGVREGLAVRRRPAEAHEDSHGRAAVRLPGLREGLLHLLSPDRTPEDPHRREALLVSRMR